MTNFNKIQLTDITTIKAGNGGAYLLPFRRVFCNDKSIKGKVSNFIRATRTNSPTAEPGANAVLPIGNAFKYIETSSGNHGYDRIFVSWERTDIIQITNITFYYNRFSISTNDSLKSKGRFRIQLLLEDNTWSTRFNIAENDRYSETSTDWSLDNLNFTVEIYGIRLIYD